MSSSNNPPPAKAPVAGVPSSDGLLEVGRIEKVHGLKGDVVVGLVTNMIEARTSAGAQLWVDGRRLSVVSARAHKNKWLMTFDGISSREAAERLRGRTLLAEPLPADAVTSGTAGGAATEVVAFVHDLIGKRLVDQHGVDHGEVEAVVDNPAADLLELVDGRLVPLSFYQHHDDRTISVDVPPGLLDDNPVDAGVADVAGGSPDGGAADVAVGSAGAVGSADGGSAGAGGSADGGAADVAGGSAGAGGSADGGAADVAGGSADAGEPADRAVGRSGR